MLRIARAPLAMLAGGAWEYLDAREVAQTTACTHWAFEKSSVSAKRSM